MTVLKWLLIDVYVGRSVETRVLAGTADKDVYVTKIVLVCGDCITVVVLAGSVETSTCTAVVVLSGREVVIVKVDAGSIDVIVDAGTTDIIVLTERIVLIRTSVSVDWAGNAGVIDASGVSSASTLILTPENAGSTESSCPLISL